jgi:hypothetical protein
MPLIVAHHVDRHDIYIWQWTSLDLSFGRNSIWPIKEDYQEVEKTEELILRCLKQLNQSLHGAYLLQRKDD